MDKKQKKKYKRIEKIVKWSNPELSEALELINELTEEIADYRRTLQVIARGYLDEEGCSKTASSILKDYPHE